MKGVDLLTINVGTLVMGSWSWLVLDEEGNWLDTGRIVKELDEGAELLYVDSEEWL